MAFFTPTTILRRTTTSKNSSSYKQTTVQQQQQQQQQQQRRQHRGSSNVLIYFVMAIIFGLFSYALVLAPHNPSTMLLHWMETELATATTTTGTDLSYTANRANATINNNNNNIVKMQERLLQQKRRLIQRQLSLSQFLSIQNTSRQLCGVIPDAAPKVDRFFPRILATPTRTTTNPNKVQQQRSHSCHSNAILYVVQKGKHSTYNRNSTALLYKSLDLLYQNYLSIRNHSDNVDLLIFHSGDYHQGDLDAFDARYNHTLHIKLIDLNNTDYWILPENVKNDNRSYWVHGDTVTVGYRHMMRWYGMKLYDFARDYATIPGGCNYRYLMRMDEDSFLLSPVEYDLFDFMIEHKYSYAFRLCSFEMETEVWDAYMDYFRYCQFPMIDNNNNTIPLQNITSDMCGFYNNFFIIDMAVVMQPQVQHFLQWMDATGYVYRDRYNDLRIQSLLVYAFVPAERIHRFLDWSYEHMTGSRRCPIWGAVQAGYLDPNPIRHFEAMTQQYKLLKRRCPMAHKNLPEQDLTPAYSHLPPSSWFRKHKGLPRRSYRWKTYAAGLVERPRGK